MSPVRSSLNLGVVCATVHVKPSGPSLVADDFHQFHLISVNLVSFHLLSPNALIGTSISFQCSILVIFKAICAWRNRRKFSTTRWSKQRPIPLHCWLGSSIWKQNSSQFAQGHRHWPRDCWQLLGGADVSREISVWRDLIKSMLGGKFGPRQEHLALWLSGQKATPHHPGQSPDQESP